MMYFTSEKLDLCFPSPRQITAVAKCAGIKLVNWFVVSHGGGSVAAQNDLVK